MMNDGDNRRNEAEREEEKKDSMTDDHGGDQQQQQQPCFTIGLIADIQYAPIDDGYSFTGTPRFYRHALEVAHEAFETFQSHQVELVINLGDTIDGKCVVTTEDDGEDDPLQHVIEAFSKYRHGPILHSYGNHCLYNHDRATLKERLGIPFRQEQDTNEWVGYYEYVHNDMKFVVLDGYDVALMQRCPDTSQKYQQAHRLLMDNNPNVDNLNSPDGLDGLQRRFVAFNGAIGTQQLQWLQGTLQQSREDNQHVVILSHNPIHPGSSSPVCLLFNYHDVLDMLRSYNDVVVACFAGHAHKGGYCRDEDSGIHFRVVEAALENRPEKTYSMVDVYGRSRLVLRGFGNCESAVYDFEHTFRAKNGRTVCAGSACTATTTDGDTCK
jgi:manganese-dependent ADP-ribose/CDP-alcohol diphosphatase